MSWMEAKFSRSWRHCTGSLLLHMCKWGLAPLIVMELEPVYLSSNPIFSNQKAGITLRIRKRAMSPNFCVLSQFTM